MHKLRILVNGKPIPTYHDRNGEIWVEARYGTRYFIEVKNDSWKRSLAIISVDGLNVVNGKRKEPDKSTGYVIGPYDNAIIKGWRISSDQIKEFYFTTPQDSYSNKLGADKKNIGVIGCVVYEEVPEVYTCTPYLDSFETTPFSSKIDNVSTYSCQSISNSSVAPTLSRKPLDTKMATGSGNKVEDRSHKVSFGKKVFAASMTIYYDSKENLVKRGVIRDNYSEELPKPFPENGNYCPDL